MIDFVRHACPKHIAVGAMSLPDRFEDVSSPLYAQHVSKDEYAQLNFTKTEVKSHVFERNKHFSTFLCTKSKNSLLQLQRM